MAFQKKKKKKAEIWDKKKPKYGIIGSWSGSQVLRLVTATSLLMICLIRAAC
jgi:hypothetical protein